MSISRGRDGSVFRVRKLRIGIIDIVSRGPARGLYARVMNSNLASIMPQVIGVWCRDQGHEVSFVCYTGSEDLLTELPSEVDLVFIGVASRARASWCRRRAGGKPSIWGQHGAVPKP
jgi:hypothetical protein